VRRDRWFRDRWFKDGERCKECRHWGCEDCGEYRSPEVVEVEDDGT
jgi:hypothetical protein